MKINGLKRKKIIASLFLSISLALIAGLTGRILVLAVTTEAMAVDWDDWIRNRNYEDSWTLTDHVGSDVNRIMNYIGLKQMLEEADGTLNLDRPALVVENEDGSRKAFSMRDLIAQGENYGIYVYRSVGNGTQVQYSHGRYEEPEVRILWSLMSKEDSSFSLDEDPWEVREERVRILLEGTGSEETNLLLPERTELEEMTTEDLLALAESLPEAYAGVAPLPEDVLKELRERLEILRQEYRDEESPDGLFDDQTEAVNSEEAAETEERTEEDTLLSVLPEETDIRNRIISELLTRRELQLATDEKSTIHDETYYFLRYGLQTYYEYEYLMKDEKSNLSYQIVMEKNGSRYVYCDPDTPKDSILTTEGMNAYYAYDSSSQQVDCTLSRWDWELPPSALKNWTVAEYSHVSIVVGMDTNNMKYEDSYQIEAASYAGYRGQVFGAVGLLVTCSIAAVVAMIWLMFLSGHKEGVEGIYLNGFDQIPTEPAAIGIMAMCSGTGMLIWLLFNVLTAYKAYQQEGLSVLLLGGCIALIVLSVYLVLWLGFYGLIRRLKAHTVWSNSLTGRFLRWCLKPIRWCTGQFRRMMNMLLNAGDTTWKTLSVFCIYFVINFIWTSGIQYASGMSMLLYLTFNAAVGVFMVWKSSQLKQVHAGVKKIADGNLGYHLPLENLNGEARRLAVQINRINVGLKNAIEASVKNERMKTELITNVSHDIKTPLTSIINYVDLLKRENIEDPRIQNYIEVLDKKSQRLKTLTEDLVEASKARSGTLKMNLERIDFIELINQSYGEFTDRFEARNLTMMPSIPEEPSYILADGRYVWRILENLYRNTEKYAMPGTRVYIDVFEKFGRIFFVMKNVSQAPLNIKAEELTERFIRGDISRSTEGSGLGLSIAKDMTELMNGTFKIYLDGDLFRVTISFAVIVSKKPDLKELEENIRQRLAAEQGKDSRRSQKADEEEETSDRETAEPAGRTREKGLIDWENPGETVGALWKGILPPAEPDRKHSGRLSFKLPGLGRRKKEKDREDQDEEYYDV
jgi:signal transduction histidine kinase